MLPLQRPVRTILNTIESNLEPLEELSMEESDLLKATTDTLIEHMEGLKVSRARREQEQERRNAGTQEAWRSIEHPTRTEACRTSGDRPQAAHREQRLWLHKHLTNVAGGPCPPDCARRSGLNVDLSTLGAFDFRYRDFKQPVRHLCHSTITIDLTG